MAAQTAEVATTAPSAHAQDRPRLPGSVLTTSADAPARAGPPRRSDSAGSPGFPGSSGSSSISGSVITVFPPCLRCLCRT